MNEASAAMGFMQLKYLDKNISKRKKSLKNIVHFSRLEQIRCIPMPLSRLQLFLFPIFNKGSRLEKNV